MNTGTYCFDNELLFQALENLTTDNAQGEYYLTDIVEILKDQGQLVGAYAMEDYEESMGVNDRVALANATHLMQKRINEAHMRNGVTFYDPEHTYVDIDVKIGADTVIEGNVSLRGTTEIGENCHITTGSDLNNAKIADQVVIKSSNIEDSVVGTGSDIGPFAHLRPASVLAENVHIGNFVEVKKLTLLKEQKLVI